LRFLPKGRAAATRRQPPMSLDTTLLSATSGLRLASRQLDLVSQNVASASVEGYTRKQAPGTALAYGGVRMTEPRRDVETALRAEARGARTEAAAAGLRADTLGPLAALQGSPSDGNSLGGLVGTLRDSFLALRAMPGDSIAQADAVDAAENLATRLNESADAVLKARQAVQDGARSDVDTANGLLRDIARLDARLRAETAAGRLDDASRDARDVAVGRLSELLDITPVEGADGGLTLILRGGAVLPLTEEGSPLGLADAQVGPDSHAGTLPALTLNGRPLNDTPRGGRIGEALALRDGTLATMAAELDTLATTLAERLSTQGLALFTEADGTAPPATGSAVANGFALRIAVSPTVRAAPGMLRDGTPGNAAFPPNPTGTAGYTGLIDRVLDFAFGERSAAGTPHPPIPTRGLGPGGNLASAFAAPVRLIDYAVSVTAMQASTAGRAKQDAAAAAGLAGRLGAMVQSREGVDVDAEMAAMVTLQNAYAANARVLATVQGMWDSLLATIR
jgi:flagellar hook-associated protein 1 FlgK